MAIYQANLLPICHETHSPMNHLFSVSIHRLFKSPILLLINVSSNLFSKSPSKHFNHIRLKHKVIDTLKAFFDYDYTSIYIGIYLDCFI
ncbi:MAG: hypothetical protein DWI24_00690 [Planctomycetota bacterium]|nr:MAG: hypothetical protein DWI24_00690 [Planctomycetota bacterium]